MISFRLQAARFDDTSEFNEFPRGHGRLSADLQALPWPVSFSTDRFMTETDGKTGMIWDGLRWLSQLLPYLDGWYQTGATFVHF